MENKDSEKYDWVYALVLIYLILLPNDEVEKFKKLLHDFEEDTNKDPNDEHIRNIIESFYAKAIYTLHKGNTIYRARIITESQLPQHTQDLLVKYHTKTLLGDISGIKALSFLLNHSSETVTDIIESRCFWGYDSTCSDAPPADKATACRINPCGVSYLYAAESPHTAVVESRPIIGQMVSVAEIEITQELALFDFCNVFDGTEDKDWILLHLIARHFSMPNYRGDIGYRSTQCISEIIKSKFDGIRFSSSLHNGGMNIVLFDVSKDDEQNPRNYKIKNSSIHFVSDITITESRIIPFSEN